MAASGRRRDFLAEREFVDGGQENVIARRIVAERSSRRAADEVLASRVPEKSGEALANFSRME
jgi:hypothetical protein